MEKRTLIALALSFVVLGSYPIILQKMYPEYYKRQALERKAKANHTQTSSSSSAATGGSAAARQSALSTNADHTLSTGKVNLVYTEADGSIRGVSFPTFAHADGKPFELFSRKTAGSGPGAVLFPDSPDPSPRDVSVRVEGDTVTTSGRSADGHFTFRQTAEWNGYSAKVRVAVENATAADQKLVYAYNLGETIPPRASIDNQYLESNFYERRADGTKKLFHHKETKSGKTVVSSGPVEWAAVKDRHFTVIADPSGDDAWTARTHGLGEHRHQTALVSPAIVLAPRGRIEQELTLYVGPVELDDLTPLGLDPIINFGKLDGIGRLLVGALEMIHKITRNYGLAIILLTMCINLLLFPLTRASFLSMKRMQDVQPQMTKLREQHKNNPEKLNREMMELYKKHKVNPFGGCLPMLLQMPVFIALYVALSKSVILINSKFLWIHDLSTPDRVHLPVSLPFVGAEIHALPLVMAVGMAVQQRFSAMNMSAQDPAMAQQQKMMGVMMPVIFCFIFYSMPSGLVLYWLTNTVLMTTYQFFLKRQTKPLAA